MPNTIVKSTFISGDQGEEAQLSKIPADAEKTAPLADFPARDAGQSVFERKGTASTPAKGQSKGAPDVDEFNAMDVASIIAKEVVQEVGGSGDKLGEVERVEGAGGSEERTMNVEPAEEIESPASSPRIEPLSLSPSLAKGDSGKKKKKKLRKKVTTPSPSSPLDETPSPPRDDTVVLILSSSEKGTLAPKVIPGSTVSESSDMDDLGESSEEGEETSGGSKEPDQGDEDQAGRLQERQGELSHSQAQDEASGPEPSEHSLFPDRQGGPRWKVKPHNAPILRALE